MKRLMLSKTLWGVKMDGPTTWDGVFQRISDDNYEAVEAIPLTYQCDPLLFQSLLKKHNLQLIIQIHTCGGYLTEDGQYIYCSSDNVNDHVDSFHHQIKSALELNPILINCHSGVDSWDNEQALSYFQQVLALEDQLLTGDWSAVKIVHETHRQRLLYSPFQAIALLSHPTLKRLKINADLSHWVCVCERIMSLTEPRDRWWPNLLTLLSSHCHFIHARVGYAEGPQIPDPRLEQWKHEVDSHLQWWEMIWSHREKNVDDRERGEQVFIIEPEHGPIPYQIYSNICPDRPLISTEENKKDELLWEINNYIATLVRERWEATKSIQLNITDL